jgi:hypothetical protein
MPRFAYCAPRHLFSRVREHGLARLIISFSLGKPRADGSGRADARRAGPEVGRLLEGESMRQTRTLPWVAVLAIMIAPALTRGATVELPHATVEGKPLSEWSAEWWQRVFALPVYAADGKTITHPQFDAPLNPGDTVNTTYGQPSNDGKVFFLFGSFFGGTLDRTVNVPAGKPVFLPILNSEWSNPDTAPPPDFTSPPGNYTQAELAAFAKRQGDTVTDLSASLDGQDVPDLLSHREAATFTYTQPAEHSITQTFFGNPITGPVESAADGIYLMISGLEPGEHTLTFTGSSPDNSGTPPLLGAFTVDMTYHLNVAGATAIPLPAGVWLGMSALPVTAFSVLRARRWKRE